MFIPTNCTLQKDANTENTGIQEKAVWDLLLKATYIENIQLWITVTNYTTPLHVFKLTY